ncbi:MAG: YigZ family protein [Clostridiales bacterium]|nr:YigZ family protein [Clostridiales bacterium]
MQQNYLSVLGQCVTEKVIEKSRFITTSRHIESEEEARAFIAELNKKYSDATHNCWAFISDTLGNLLRFSDDGEPQGTAGMPMLEVLKVKKLMQTAVVVTRYFGGIKLGAGGLVRAYSGSVAENIERAQKVFYQVCAESLYTVDYPLVDAISRYFSQRECEVKSTDYGNQVTYTVAVKKDAENAFNAEVINLLNGKVKVQKLKEYFYPFKV